MSRDKLTPYLNTPELNLGLSIDNLLADKWGALAPHFNMLNFNNPGEVSNFMYLTDPVAATASNWLSCEKVYTDNDKIAKMSELIKAIT